MQHRLRASGLSAVLAAAVLLASTAGSRASAQAPTWNRWRPPSPELTRALAATQDAEKAARALYEQGKYRQAEAMCRKALALSPQIHPQSEPARPFNLFALRLLGDILLAEDRPADALPAYLACYPHFHSWEMDVNATIAACRAGEYPTAQRLLARVTAAPLDWANDPDRPSDRTPAGIEACALLARGLHRDVMLLDKGPALADLLQAEKLAPNSAVVAYHCAEQLCAMGRKREGIARYRRAATLGHGPAALEAKARAENGEAILRAHPEIR